MAQATLSGCLVRILDRKGDPCGVGFLADPEHVITCAHVVADAHGWLRTVESPPEEAATVEVDFPLLAPGEALTARICAWHPMREPPTAGVPEALSIRVRLQHADMACVCRACHCRDHRAPAANSISRR